MNVNETLKTPDANNTDAGGQQDNANPDVKTEGQAAPDTKQTEGEGKTANTEGEKKADEGSDKPKTEGDDANKDAEKKPSAPEKYEDFTLPEEVSLEPETVGVFSELAKKHGLSQEAAQEFVTLGASLVGKTAMRPAELLNEATNQWAKDTAADKELGGDKLPENLAVAKKALDAFASPELKTLLGKFDAKENPKGTGLGNHPELIRLFHRIGKSISEDNTIVTGGTTDMAGRDPADVLYGKK